MSSAHFRMGNDITNSPCSEQEPYDVSFWRDHDIYFASWAELWTTVSNTSHPLHKWATYMSGRKKFLQPARHQRIRISIRENCGEPIVGLVPTIAAQVGSYVVTFLGVAAFLFYLFTR